MTKSKKQCPIRLTVFTKAGARLGIDNLKVLKNERKYDRKLQNIQLK